MNGTQELYFKWLSRTVGSLPSHIEYMRKLFITDFTYTIPMDANRESDGIALRYEFGRQMSIPEPVIASEIDIRPCSVLEMMVALAIRIEVDIMGAPDGGLTPGRWFWTMIQNMDVNKMLTRTYNADGSGGGLFVLNNPRKDLRVTEIWYQAMWYLSEHYI